MTENDRPDQQDVEGHRLRVTDDGAEVEGHKRAPRVTDDEEVEAHRRKVVDDDEDDVEGHVQPPRDLDIDR